MSDRTLYAAQAALHYWAATANGTAAIETIPSDLRDHLRQTAWLIAGQPDGISEWPQTSETALISIFARIKRRQHQALPDLFIRSASLRIHEDVIFPSRESISTEESLVGSLTQALDDLKGRGLTQQAQLEGTLFALHKHAWGMPSPIMGVSLYDFARLHAALAAATVGTEPNMVCLVGGDISGVQEFIYSVPAKGATKQLRGRSLYLQLLTDACAHYVLNAAGMPLSNLLYAGGGRFYVLLPHSATEQIASWRREIGRVLLAAHHGALYLALGSRSFDGAEYGVEAWRGLTESIDQDKRRRFAALDQAEFAKLFEPRQPEPPAEDAGADAPEPLDPLSVSLGELGGQIGRTTTIAVIPGAPQARMTPLTWDAVLASLGLRVQLSTQERGAQQPTHPYRRLLVLSDATDSIDPTPNDIVGIRYSVTEAKRLNATDVRQATPVGEGEDDLKAGNVMPFNMLADQSRGVKRLGVLRMDVDDLGDLFGQGFDRAPGMAALACTTALSAALGRFFEGWIGELCRSENADGRTGGVYAVYSGGDDLFLVGSWDRMPTLARRIREDFTRYIHGQALQKDQVPLVSLSAGLSLHTGSYPLYQAADDAADALSAAKEYVRIGDKQRKDAITFLGRTLGWEQFAEASAFCDELVELVHQGVPRSLLMSIQSLDSRSQQGRRTRDGTAQFAYGPWIWQGAYQLSRVAERADSKVREQVTTLRDRIVGAEGVRARTIERAGLAARWAQLQMRERSNNKEDQ